MSVYKSKSSPYWLYDFQLKGVRYHGSTGVENRQEAVAIEAAERTKAARAHAYGEPKKRPQMALKEVFGRYWSEVSQHTAGADDDLTALDRMATHLGPNMLISDLDDDRVALLVAKLRGRKAPGKLRLVANSTVNRDINRLRGAWKRAARVWKVDVGDEPLWGKHILEEADSRVRDLTPDEQERLLSNLREDYHPLVRFALMSGCRFGNLRSLKWSDVDYQAGVITLRLKSRKPGGRVHILPLTGQMVALLANERGKHSTYVFTYQCTRPRGARKKDQHYPFSRDGWRRVWAAACAASGLEDFHFHDLRHTAATRTLRASGNMKAVQKMLGHTQITTTARYAHALTEDVRSAMEAGQSRNSPEQGESERSAVALDAAENKGKLAKIG